MSISTDASSTAPLAGTPAPPSDWENAMSAVSSTLGLTTGDLRRRLGEGASLSSIATARGVSQQDVARAIEGALRA